MIVHHIVTIMLVFFSWAINFSRIGTLVFLAHDIADIPMAVSLILYEVIIMSTNNVGFEGSIYKDVKLNTSLICVGDS